MTRAYIWIRRLDGKFDGVYVNADGYPEGLGEMLLECGSEAEAAEEFYDDDNEGLNITEVSEESIVSASKYVDYAYIFKDGDWYFFWYEKGTHYKVKDYLALDDDEKDKIFEE